MLSAQTESNATSLDALNLTTYRDKRIVQWYVYSHEVLLPPEEVILREYKEALQGKKVLDIGVGGGRTAFYLSQLTQGYIGIDYSPEMVAGCQQKYQHLRFLECDARNLSPFKDESFDTVLFSWNGMDYVNHDGRLLILKEVCRVLKPNGTFIFSSHNRDFPQTGSRIEPTRHPLKYLARWIRLYQGKLRHVTRKQNELHTDEYCILNDAAHEYKLMTYYISPLKQIEQLHQNGFLGPVALYDTSGNRLEEPASTCEYLYYCVQKSP